MTSDEAVLKRLEDILAQVRSACTRVGRSDPVSILGVTKGQSAETVAAWRRITERKGLPPLVGENYLQEWQEKVVTVPPGALEAHFIGRLQRNKVAKVVELFDVIQSVDSRKLLEEIQRVATRQGKRQRVMLQVNISADDAKQGFEPVEVHELLRTSATRYPALAIEGLMTITRLYDNPERARPDFKRLAELRRELNRPDFALSMGMSSDYIQAIEEGATMIRLGTSLFGERYSI